MNAAWIRAGALPPTPVPSNRSDVEEAAPVVGFALV
jgi:hypothetical protein